MNDIESRIQAEKDLDARIRADLAERYGGESDFPDAANAIIAVLVECDRWDSYARLTPPYTVSPNAVIVRRVIACALGIEEN